MHFFIVAILFAVALYAAARPDNQLIDKVRPEHRSTARKCAIGLAVVLGLVLLHAWFWTTLFVAVVAGAVVLYRRKHQPVGKHKRAALKRH